MLPARQRRRLLNANHIVFQAEIRIDVLFRLEMSSDDPRAVAERQRATVRRELMRQMNEKSPSEIVEALHHRLPDLAQQQAFQPWHPLAVVNSHLRQQPM